VGLDAPQGPSPVPSDAQGRKCHNFAIHPSDRAGFFWTPLARPVIFPVNGAT
jgi:hypothetical protein